MPALVYWFARPELRPTRLARHDRRLHHAADAAVLPARLAALRRRSTCRRRSRSSTGSSSTSTCPSRSRSGRTRRRCRRAAATSPSTASGSATTPTAPWTLEDVVVRGAGRHADGDRRRDRLRQDHARLPRRRGSTTSTAGGCSLDGIDVRDVTFASLARTVGVVSQETYLFHASIRENLRFAKPDATDEEIEDAARAAHIHELIAEPRGGLRHARRRARLPLLRRREAADRDRADDPAQPARARPRRGDERARHAHGAGGAGGARPPRRGPDDDRDRAPALDGARRRPDRRPRPRPDRGARHARRAARPRRRATRRLVARDAFRDEEALV